MTKDNTIASLRTASVFVDPESDPQPSVSFNVQAVTATNALIGNVLSYIVEGIKVYT